LDNTMVLADIPGLIEGASEGVGLGHEFLRHVQRTRVLIHVLDGLSEDPVEDFDVINNELYLFDERLGRLPQVVVLNKMDLPNVEAKYETLSKTFAERDIEIMPISAATGMNLKELMWRSYQLLLNTPIEDVEETLPVYRADEDPRAFEVEQIDEETWQVSGKMIEKAAAMTYFDQIGSVRRFQRLMERLGVERALRQAGVQEGDTVVIGEWEMVWHD